MPRWRTFQVPWRTLLVMDPGSGAGFELPDHVGGVRFRFHVPFNYKSKSGHELV
jgi:hypothetical protein